MKKMKRLLVLCLAAVMLMGVMVIPASAVFTAADAEAYVTQLYEGLLDRKPDDGGKLDYVNRLYSQNASAGQVAQYILGSAEFRAKEYNNEQYVRALYKGLLGRNDANISQEEVDNYVDLLNCGQSRAWLYQQFLGSAEFKNLCENTYNMYVGKYPTDNNAPSAEPTSVHSVEAEGYVTTLYQGLLGHAPDADGLKHWVNMLHLRKMSAAGVATAIASSQEFNAKAYTNAQFITCCYEGLLGRHADPAGYAMWVDQLNAGKTRSAIFAAFCNSAEFQNRVKFAPGAANVTPGSLTSAQTGGVSGGAVNTDAASAYISRLYLNLLNRNASTEEVQGWVDQLVARRMSAAGVAAAIASSAEARKLGFTREDYVEKLYLALLGRPSDPIGKGTYVGALRSGYSRSWVFSKIVASAEFQGMDEYRNMNVVPGTLNYASYDMG